MRLFAGLVVLALLVTLAPVAMYAQKAPMGDDSQVPGYNFATALELMDSQRSGRQLVASRTAVPGATTYFDSSGIVRKLTSPGLATSATKPADAATAFLKANHAMFGLSASLSELAAPTVQTSLGGYHIRYKQVAGGQIPVWETQVAVHLNRDLKLKLLQNYSLPLSAAPSLVPRVTAAQATAAAVQALQASDRLRAAATSELVVYATSSRLGSAGGSSSRYRARSVSGKSWLTPPAAIWSSRATSLRRPVQRQRPSR